MAPQRYCETAWQGGWLQYPAQWGISFIKGEKDCYQHLIAGMTFQATVGTFTCNLVKNVSYPLGGGVAVGCCHCKVGRGLWGANSSLNMHKSFFFIFLKKKKDWGRNPNAFIFPSLVAIQRWHLSRLPVVGTPGYLGLKPKDRRKPTAPDFVSLGSRVGGGGRKKRELEEGRGLSKALKCGVWEDGGTVPKPKLGWLRLDNRWKADLSLKWIS